MTTFKKLKYDSNLKPRFSKEKLRLEQFGKVGFEIQAFKNLTIWNRKTNTTTTRLNIDIERSFKNGIHDIANY